MSATDSKEWVPRRELALPNELLHKIILWVLCDSVHTICVSTEDTYWEKNVMETFHQVSPAFKAISNELAIKTFDIAKDIRQDDVALLRTLHEIFVYLSHLGMRFRHPSDWGSVSFRTIDCCASSFVFAYALYLSCTSLRRNASRSPRDVFESTHKVMLSALAQAEALCDRVRPDEMTFMLRDSVEEEYELAKSGLQIVGAFNDLENHCNSMSILQPSEISDGSGPVTAVRSLIHSSLSKVEAAHEYYRSFTTKNRSDPQLYELPGVLPALRKIAGLRLNEDEYNLQQRIHMIISLWSDKCPFLNKPSNTCNE